MKYFFSLLLVAVSFAQATAQDVKKVQTMFLLGKIEDAKTEIDKVVADPKSVGKPETWYWKSRIYANLYATEATKAKYPNAKSEADEAFKKYVQLDPTFALVKSNGPNGFFDMYSSAFNQGLAEFKAKNWEAAAKAFEGAVYYSDFIFKNKWSSSSAPFDTTSILYAGYSYQNAHIGNEAVKFYTRLAESKANGEGLADAYKFVVDYYTKQKDKANFDKYIAISKDLFPKENWEDFEIQYIDQNLDLREKTDLYDKWDAAGTMSENQYIMFGDEFVNVKHKEADSSIHDKYTRKGIEAFKKAFTKNAQNGLAAYNVGVTYYNFFNEEDDKYANNIRTLQQLNANKPVEKDPKKKVAAEAKFKEQTDAIRKLNLDVEKKAIENADLAIEWLNKAFVVLKDKEKRSTTERSVINKTVDFLANLYQYRANRTRGKDQKASDSFDAKYKEFDALHGKY